MIDTKKTKHLLSLTLAILVAAAPAAADSVSYYVGVDNLATLTSGTYVGLPNPNLGRLTLLFNHGDHFHGIGAYSYQGAADSAVVTPTNANNRIPEISANESPLPLVQGSGVYSNRLVSQAGSSEYSEFIVNSMNSLAGAAAGTPEEFLLNSSDRRWASSISNAQIGLELVSATPGLLLGDQTRSNLFPDSGAAILLGSGSGFTFAPTFSTSTDAAPRAYSATLRLVDLMSGTPSSGQFTFDFAVQQAVPEPGSAALVAAGIMSAIVGLRKARVGGLSRIQR